MKSVQQKRSQNMGERCVSTMIKPLRIFQFLVVLALFVFAIYMTVMDPTPISNLVCILLIALSGVYVFALAVELIRQFAGKDSHNIPMFVFSLLGILLFGVAGILLIASAYTGLVLQLAAAALCLLAALIFLIDITTILAFWKRRCSICKRCCYHDTAKLLLPRDEDLDRTDILKRDATTSVSDVRLAPAPEAGAIPDHSYRRIEQPRRRTYIDRPTSVASLIHVDVAEAQTDPTRISVVESQTAGPPITKETPIQTLSKCEFCQRQLQIFAQEPPAAPCLQHPPQWSCPAIVQFVRGAGGVGVPCCPGCKCATGTTQTQTQHRPVSAKRLEPTTPGTNEATQQVASKSDIRTKSGLYVVQGSMSGTDTEGTPRLAGVAETVTKLTLASFYVKPNKRIQTLPKVHTDTAYSRTPDIEEVRENMRPINEEVTTGVKNVDARSRGTTIVETAKKVEKGSPSILGTEIPALEAISVTGILTGSIENRGDDSKLEDVEGSDKSVERNKGGGEERICRRFARATEQGSAINIGESPRQATATQMSSATLITPSTSKTKHRTFLHLKSNKVDPIEDESLSYRRVMVEHHEATGATYISQEDEPPESPSSIGHRAKEVCSLCRREKGSTPTSDNSRYYTLFKGTRGGYLCEFCAPPHCKKVVSRIEDTDVRKLRCANCRFSLRGRGGVTNAPRSDGCPKCGQPRKRLASPSSM